MTSTRAITLPSVRPNPHPAPRRRPLPCYVILIHGVNDLGEAYPQQEDGICQGLNERLDRGWDLRPSPYTLPGPTHIALPDPDRTLFRRTPAPETYSPVIPFYWGFREDPAHTTVGLHGQRVDRFGNRLDADGAKEGGPFANATNSLPDMWAPGWRPSGHIPDRFNHDPTHPLLEGPPRSYMVLAALRLELMITLIRQRHPEAAINLVAHSQGCLISLLAVAFLARRSVPPPDTLILQHPPYSLQEPDLDFFNQRGFAQQTSEARIHTLANLARYLHVHRQTAPWPGVLKPRTAEAPVMGPHWGHKPDPGKGGALVPFPERDNRGKTYLYFCPDEGTVSLYNHQGIGWQGVPDRVHVTSSLTTGTRTLPALEVLGPGFRQRVFTDRIREGRPLPVGLPPATILLRAPGDREPSGWVNAPLVKGETRQITGEALHPPVPAQLRTGDTRGPGFTDINPIDAAIAVTHGGWQGAFREEIDDPRPPGARFPLTRTVVTKEEHLEVPDPAACERIKPMLLAAWNRAHIPASEQDPARRNAMTCWDAEDIAPSRTPGKLWFTRKATADEARAWLQQHGRMTNSYHSGIPAYMPHHKYVTAYDLSLGRPIPWSEDQRTFMNFLREVGDWRNPRGTTRGTKSRASARRKLDALNDHAKVGHHFTALHDRRQIQLVTHTALYHEQGRMPWHVSAEPAPVEEATGRTQDHGHLLLHSETLRDRGLPRPQPVPAPRDP